MCGCWEVCDNVKVIKASTASTLFSFCGFLPTDVPRRVYQRNIFGPKDTLLLYSYQIPALQLATFDLSLYNGSCPKIVFSLSMGRGPFCAPPPIAVALLRQYRT
ncbi:hypothetical protein Pint_23721 [Pistacia integerrima]|uniref:Uncharacterized protein n=1 Tax=Pistacia integerrima TaxID=434235 RepID=A0ACC0YN60_9ROSI|nr:hypothetical protein Pint_23721 [Pistacia integerrima]